MTGDVIGTCTEIKNEQYKLNLYYEKYAIKETIRERISYYKSIDSDVLDIEGILKAMYIPQVMQAKTIFNCFLS